MSEILHHGYPCPMSDDEITEALWKLGGYSPEGVAVQETIAHLRAENERLREAIGERVSALRRACIRVLPNEAQPWMWLALLGEARDAADALDEALAAEREEKP